MLLPKNQRGWRPRNDFMPRRGRGGCRRELSTQDKCAARFACENPAYITRRNTRKGKRKIKGGEASL